MSMRLACAGTPPISLKPAISVSTPAHTAAWNGGRYTSRRVRSETSAGL
jgi:hypothetical protein